MPYAKNKFTESVGGQPIGISATTSPGDLISTAIAGSATSWDEFWLYATNRSGSTDAAITIEFGGTAGKDKIIVGVPWNDGTTDLGGYIKVVEGLILNNALTVKVFADTTDIISVWGWRNTITPTSTNFEKRKLSGSTDGKSIEVAATATLGTTIHAATSSTTAFDEVWLYAMNRHGSDVTLTLEAESTGTTAAEAIASQTIPFQEGLVRVMPGMIFNNSTNIRAFASVANVVSIFGFINRITP